MILKCMRASCRRTLADVDGITTGDITLICPKCAGRSTYKFLPENRLQPDRKFTEKAREGASQSELHRTDLRASGPAAPACDQLETPSPAAPAQSGIARRSRSAV